MKIFNFIFGKKRDDMNVVIYSKKYCGYCLKAKEFFESKNISFQEIDLTNDFDKLDALKNKTGLLTVPQIFINDVLIGGYAELIEKIESGELKL